METGKKRVRKWFFVLLVTILIGGACGMDAAGYSGGAGTENDPYQIANVNDLLELAADTSNYNKYFILTADIDLQGQVFATALIAPDTINDDDFEFDGIAFTGTFDGKCHKIVNLTVEGQANDFVGLFGYIDNSGWVSNLSLEECNINGEKFVGGLVGYNADGSITNCYSTGIVTATSFSNGGRAGGLVGENHGIISNCYSTASVSGLTTIIVHENPNYGSVYSCNAIGGLVGLNEGSIRDCHSTGAVFGDYYSQVIGGLVGNNGLSISNCYSTSTVSACFNSKYIGGLAGHNDGSISNCCSTGSVSSSSSCGVWWRDPHPTEASIMGGLVGSSYLDTSISQCYSTGAVSGGYGLGGLVGTNYGGDISQCYSTSTVSSPDGCWYYYVNNGSFYISSCDCIGGLVGYSGGVYGGITDCYSMGAVSSPDGCDVGGLVGISGHVYGRIENCYSTGAVSGNDNVGGLVGSGDDVISGFWDIETSGQATSSGGTGKTTAEMQTESTFTDAGWDFTGETVNGIDDIWQMCAESNSYPRLSWQSIYGDYICPDQWCVIYYVDTNATGSNNGHSWEDAYTNLQDALDAARDCSCMEIRVAKGMYKPDQNSVYPNGSGDRNASFVFVNGAAIKGGYAGFSGPDPNARDIRQYETILSGDLKGNDNDAISPLGSPPDPCLADNSYHVVTGSYVDNTTILDGFTIMGGHANGSNAYGGGMYNYDSSVKVINCTFRGNSALSGGGGMCNDYGSPTVRKCLFEKDWAVSGGGMYNFGDFGPAVINCLFKNNLANGGGGILNNSHQIIVTNCTFVGNVGGGICNGAYGDGTATNCILWGNENGQISGGNVSYSCIQGGYSGVGNIDADPKFAPGGYYLTLYSPCIDAGDPNYDGELNGIDIDGEPRIIDGNCNGEARVDMGVDEYYPTPTDCDAFLRANCPSPSCRATDVAQDVNLCWIPGVFADTHNVYLGTDFDDVKEADTNSPEYKGNTTYNCYDPCGLEPNTTYFWRVDEVNGLNIWKGDVWHFTVPDYNVVDDFEAYTGTNEGDHRLRDYWHDRFAGDNSTVSEVYLRTTDPTLDEQSMRYWFRNNASPYYSEAWVFLGDLGINKNWVGMNVKALVLWFYGQADNPVSEKMYIQLTDCDGNSATVLYGDMNDITVEDWQEWNVSMGKFLENNDVNLACIDRITIGFDPNHEEPYVDGQVFVDDIRLYVTRCRADIAAVDMDGDCAVNFIDFAILANKWLDMGCCEDLHKDGEINFEDIAIMAGVWLEKEVWP